MSIPAIAASPVERPGSVGQPSHHRWADEPAHHADRVDECEAGGGAHAGEGARRDGPEYRPCRGDVRERRGHDRERCPEAGHEQRRDQGGGREQAGDGEVADLAAVPLDVAGRRQHDQRGDDEAGAGAEADLEIREVAGLDDLRQPDREADDPTRKTNCKPASSRTRPSLSAAPIRRTSFSRCSAARRSCLSCVRPRSARPPCRAGPPARTAARCRAPPPAGLRAGTSTANRRAPRTRASAAARQRAGRRRSTTPGSPTRNQASTRVRAGPGQVPRK